MNSVLLLNEVYVNFSGLFSFHCELSLSKQAFSAMLGLHGFNPFVKKTAADIFLSVENLDYGRIQSV